MAEIFNPTLHKRVSTRNSLLKLNQPSRKTNQGQNCLSFIGPSIWNKLPDKIKESKSINNFKHKVKEYFFEEKNKK